MSSQSSFILNYWGKAQPAGNSAVHWHPAAYHCLDVVAAGDAITGLRPRLMNALSRETGIPLHVVKNWMLLQFAFHDLGKFADCFQSLVPEKWCAANQSEWIAKRSAPKSLRHGEAGLVLWCGPVGDAVEKALGWDYDTRAAFECWLFPVFGHHGKPIPDNNHSVRITEIATEKAVADAVAYAVAAARMFDSRVGVADLERTRETELKRTSWLVSGLSVMADWIGSNQSWFPYTRPDLSLEEYWSRALSQAREAVTKAGLATGSVVSTYGLNQALNADDVTATPLQEWAATVAIPENGPCLAFLEDLTGSGKTEAALILAHRLMASDRASGLYWALPTQATANALYKRLSRSYRNLFETGGTKPSLALAHASTDLQDDYQKSIFREGLTETLGRRSEREYGARDEETASALCAEWLASDRRRSLLADVGVGTVDQALLAALPVKFQSLRLTALADRVLVVDEAHSFDKFTTRLLMQTLSFQAALGGSAIILSATLTNAVKNDLMTAFASGAGWVNTNWCEKAAASMSAFPLASLLSAPRNRGNLTPAETLVAPQRGTRRDLPIKRLGNAEESVASLISHARAGRCAVWIRNTVQDAIDGIEAVQAAEPEISTLLFHARFTLADRARIEKQVLDLFGKESKPKTRAPGGLGRILVATQVIEQSLDLDFDAMVTDLAPIDLLIQRAGRLHRHDRGPRPEPVLEIVSPPPDDDAPANWYASLFERGAYVYQHPSHLWRTMRLLEDAGTLRLASANPRDLLHDVFDVADYPASFDPQVAEWEGKCSAHRAIAAAQGLVILKGYSEQQRGFYDEARTPTRLGDETRVVRLAKWKDGRLTPWAKEEADEGRAWRMSEIQIRAAKAETRGAYAPEIEKAAAAIENTWAGRAQAGLLLPLTAEGGAWCGSLANAKRQKLHIRYDVEKGFQFLE